MCAMTTAGIDIGSMTAKSAVIKDGQLLGTRIISTGYDHAASAVNVYEQLLNELGLQSNDIQAVVSTGYGRNSVEFADKSMTEIICHGTGAHFLSPDTRGIIDVGGQDSKAILLDDSGQVIDFAMNDKCAAGTGRFLDVMAKALEVRLEDLGEFALAADRPSKISSICTVFAESEVISMISRREKRENIIAGIHESAAARISALAAKIKLKPPVMMTGGVAMNPGMVRAIENRLGILLHVFETAQANGAIGAAVMAYRLASEKQKKD